MRKMMKELAILLLIFSMVFGTVYAVNLMISNRITQTIDVTRTSLIEITVTDFPLSIEIGMEYVFTVETKSLADQELADLVTWITISYIDGETAVTLDPAYFFIHYSDTGFDGIPSYEGEIQSTFTWDDTEKYLVSTAMGGGTWNAPIDYSNTARITFRILADAPLPDGTLTWETWVEIPLQE